MERDPSRWLNRFIWSIAAITLLLICSGGMVTSKGVGLAVPDWPTTFGYNMFLFPVSGWVGGVFFEHTHRLLASTVGMLTLILAVWLWLREVKGSGRWVGVLVMVCGAGVLGVRTQPVQIGIGVLATATVLFAVFKARQSAGSLRWLGVVALGAVILQGVLGGLRVVMLKDEIGIFHALVAQAFLGFLVFLALRTTRFWSSLKASASASPRVLPLAVMATTLIYLQLGLGATMRHQHQDLSILDFPTAYGAWIPDTSDAALAAINQWRDARALSDVTAFQVWLQMAHRFVALLVAAAVITCASRTLKSRGRVALRRLALGWVVLLFCQVTLGAWVIWSNKAADVATTHVAVGAVMLSLGVVLSAICWRLSRAAHHSNHAGELAPAARAVSV